MHKEASMRNCVGDCITELNNRVVTHNSNVKAKRDEQRLQRSIAEDFQKEEQVKAENDALNLLCSVKYFKW